LYNSRELDSIAVIRQLKLAIVLQFDYIHVLEITRENLCTVVGLPEMIADFNRITSWQRICYSVL